MGKTEELRNASVWPRGGSPCGTGSGLLDSVGSITAASEEGEDGDERDARQSP